MLAFAMRRVGGAVVLIVLVPALTFVFFTLTVTGGPVWSSLGTYLSDTFLHGRLGNSQVLGSPEVAHLLRTGVAADLSLLAGGLVLGLAAGVAAGAHVARRGRSRRSAALQGLGALALSAPVQTTGFVLVVFLGSTGGDHPLFFVSDSGTYRPLTQDPLAWLHALWVPWLSVALPIAGAMMRLTVSGTREALGEDAVRTAAAKGLGAARIVRRHALPFAVPGLAALGGASMNLMILNIALMETLFNIPGSFRYAREAVDHVDLPLIQGMVLVGVVYIVVGNLIADLLVARIDPRTRA